MDDLWLYGLEGVSIWGSIVRTTQWIQWRIAMDGVQADRFMALWIFMALKGYKS